MISLTRTPIVPAKSMLTESEAGKVEVKRRDPPLITGPMSRPEDRDPNVVYAEIHPGTGISQPGRTVVINGEAYPLRSSSESNSVHKVAAKIDTFQKTLRRQITPPSSKVPGWGYIHSPSIHKSFACYSGGQSSAGKSLARGSSS